MKRSLSSVLVRLTVTACTVGAIGCSAPKIKPSPALQKKALHTVAVLPPHASTAVPRERVANLRFAVQNELSNQGFSVIDAAVVDNVCTDDGCPRRGELIANYPIDAFATLTIESASRNNFLAGYYNAIVGRLDLRDVEGVELLEIRHTESERGGLLFNSGQILQGLISQVRNGDDAAFATLANKFAQTVVASIPRPAEAPASAPPEAPTVNETLIESVEEGVYRVCATGSSRGFAAVVLKSKARTNLREVAPGRYCGNYLVASPTQFMNAEVELRDAFGTATRAPLGPLPPQSTEACTGAIATEQRGPQTIFVSPCPQNTARLLIYTAPTATGPFVKIAEVKGASWKPQRQRRTPGEVYAFIAVDRNGLLSDPKLFTSDAKEGA